MNFLDLVRDEVEYAQRLFPALHSAHEALGVIREEYLEFEAEVFKSEKKRDYPAMLQELVQLAAMCYRASIDLNLMGKE